MAKRKPIQPVAIDGDRPKGRQGFASMDPARRREITSMGGKTTQRLGKGYKLTGEKAREAGQIGGTIASRDRAHMAEIGRKGGLAGKGIRRARRASDPVTVAVNRSAPSPVRDDERATLQRVFDFLVANALRGPSLLEAAKVAGLSPFHLHRRFRLAFGRTMKNILTDVQIDEAKRLILVGMPLTAVAAECGFANLSHLISRFRQQVGTTPLAWRDQQWANEAQRPT